MKGKMETIQIVRKTLIIPEPKVLWTLGTKEKKRLLIETKMVWAVFRKNFGFVVPASVSSLVFGTSPKENQKYDKSEELISGLSLAQNNLSGINVCHWSTKECRFACVGKNGNNGFPSIMRAKIAKTRFLFQHPEEAGILLGDFWEKAWIKGNEVFGAQAKDMVGGRMNTFSDINWIDSAPWIFEHFQGINYYDYTKEWARVSPFENYHLTYSAGEGTTDDEIVRYLEQGWNVAVVFSKWSTLPTSYLGFTVIDGDKSDVRWKDPAGVIVGLRRKGRLKATSPMVRVA